MSIPRFVPPPSRGKQLSLVATLALLTPPTTAFPAVPAHPALNVLPVTTLLTPKLLFLQPRLKHIFTLVARLSRVVGQGWQFEFARDMPSLLRTLDNTLEKLQPPSTRVRNGLQLPPSRMRLILRQLDPQKCPARRRNMRPNTVWCLRVAPMPTATPSETGAFELDPALTPRTPEFNVKRPPFLPLSRNEFVLIPPPRTPPLRLCADMA